MDDFDRDILGDDVYADLDVEEDTDDGSDAFDHEPDVPPELERNGAVVGNITLHPAQAEFVLSQAKTTVGQAGIRGGKTEGGAIKEILYALDHPCKADEVHLVCSPTFPMSKVPTEKLFALLYDKTKFPINPLIKYHKSARVFELQCRGKGRSFVQVVSLHDPNRIRGLKALSAWMDEGAYTTKEAYDIVSGRLMDVNGPMWITTTPAGYNWVHELYEQAVKEKRAGVPLEKRLIRFLHWTSMQNPFIKAEGIANLLAQYDSKTAEQEIKGLFVKLAGLVYRFSRRRNIMPWKLQRDKPVFVGQDFNVAMMSSIFTQQPTRATIQAFHERVQPESDTYGLVTYLNEWCLKNNFPKRQLYIFPDASGAARSTSGKSDTRLLRDAGFKVVYAKKNPFIKDRVNCVNGLLQPASGPTRYGITPDCHKSIECFEKQIWDTELDPPVPDKKAGFDHQMDANGYVCWGRLPLAVQASLGNMERKAA